MEWLEFILANRQSEGANVHPYDVVIGPTAVEAAVDFLLRDSTVVGCFGFKRPGDRFPIGVVS